MRTARILKFSAHGVIAVGIFFALRYFHFTSLEFCAAIFLSFLLWVVLRLFACVGQFIFEIKNDALRTLANLERGLHYSNSLAKEIRDLVDEEGSGEKNR